MIDQLRGEGTLTLPSDLEITMQRIFQAPARLLFDVWTKPEHVRRWYGVCKTTVTVCDIDLRLGGAWRWVVVTPQGVEVAFSGVFLEIDPPHLIRRTELFEGMPGPGCVVTLKFDEDAGMTTLTMNMRFESARDRDLCLKSGMDVGVKECYENIDSLLATLMPAA